MISWLGEKHGIGTLETVKLQLINKEIKNITLGIHAEDEELIDGYGEIKGEAHTLYIGLLFVRLVFEFRKYE